LHPTLQARPHAAKQLQEANPTGVALGTNANLKVRASDRDAAGYYRMQIGAFEITALSDGSSPLPFPAKQMLVNVTPDEVAATLKDSFPEDPVETSINGFLVNTGTRLIFVDWQKWQ
jgi:hypothetical protein